nr:hypothetical protein [Pandoravirus aubagnensis]
MRPFVVLGSKGAGVCFFFYEKVSFLFFFSETILRIPAHVVSFPLRIRALAPRATQGVKNTVSTRRRCTTRPFFIWRQIRNPFFLVCLILQGSIWRQIHNGYVCFPFFVHTANKIPAANQNTCRSVRKRKKEASHQKGPETQQH